MVVRIHPGRPFQRHSSTGEQPVDNRPIVVRLHVSLYQAATEAVPLTAASGRLLHFRNATHFEAPWSNGYDVPLSAGRSGFNSPWGRQLRAYRLTARTSGSHPDGRGSNPRTLTSFDGLSSNGQDAALRRLRWWFESTRADQQTRCGPGEGRLLREQENAGSNPVVATIRPASLAHGRPFTPAVAGRRSSFSGSSNGKTLLLQRRDGCSIHPLGTM